MIKHIRAWSFIVLTILAGGVRDLASQVPPEKAGDPAKSLVRVDKPEEAPEPLAAGFNAVSAEGSLAMLSFLASNLLEGRETGTRGLQLAAEYAASLFSLWHIKPLGDIPPRRLNLAQYLAGAAASSRPMEKGFFQEFAIEETTESSNLMTLEARKGAGVKTRSFEPGHDYVDFSPTRPGTVSSSVVFAGYGISEEGVGYDDLKGLDVEGKIVLILAGAPGRDDPKSPFQRDQALKDKYAIQPRPGGAFPGAPAGQFDKVSEIRKRRPAAVLQVVNPGQEAALFRRQLGLRGVPDEEPIINKTYNPMRLPGVSDDQGGPQAPGIVITRHMADALLEASGQTVDALMKRIEATGKPASMEVPGTRLTIETTAKSRLIRGINVVGMIEGSDPAVKDEVIVVGAHLDHVGAWQDYVFNGADDNGSGSVGVLNLARAFSAGGPAPRRTVVFCLWDGEEKGLLGSKFFVLNPPLPKSRIVAYLNLDMMSRRFDEKSLQFAGRMLNIPVTPELIGQVRAEKFLPVLFSSGSGFGELVREADRYVGLDVYLREAAGAGLAIGSSDHAPFHDAKIPWLYPVGAVTEDLHQTSDSVDKVSGDFIEKISELMYTVAFRLAQR